MTSNIANYLNNVEKLINCAHSVDCISDEEAIKIAANMRAVAEDLFKSTEKVDRIYKTVYGHPTNGKFTKGIYQLVEELDEKFSKLERRINQLFWSMVAAIITQIILGVIGR